MEVTSPAANDGPALRDGPLQPGDSIPDFSLPADDGTTYSRQSLAGQRFVIYFYPRDNTPGCTQEACDFRDRQPQLDAAGTLVLGVSGDSIKSHAGFRAKHGLGFPLLADTDRSVAAAFGALGEKSMYGRKSIGIIRSTFVVGPDGVVLHTFAPVRVKGHADAVLQALGEG
ncbi:MAG: peroxiredoxin [Myxococcales bacterium]|nr:peroxiredoxin [Myxococcales bacterium]